MSFLPGRGRLRGISGMISRTAERDDRHKDRRAGTCCCSFLPISREVSVLFIYLRDISKIVQTVTERRTAPNSLSAEHSLWRSLSKWITMTVVSSVPGRFLISFTSSLQARCACNRAGR